MLLVGSIDGWFRGFGHTGAGVTAGWRLHGMPLELHHVS